MLELRVVKTRYVRTIAANVRYISHRVIRTEVLITRAAGSIFVRSSR
jgi:hypothetical protein